MRNVSTFGSFTTARLGIYAAQKGLEVTGNNITNINTTGYTRQRLDQISFVGGGADHYTPPFGVKVGNGVLTTGVSQLRDPFLDIAYRNAQTNVGEADAKLAGLEDIAQVLDEVGAGTDENGVIYNQFQTLADYISQMITEGAGHDEYEQLVRSAAGTLTDLFRTYAKELQEKFDNQVVSLQQDVDAVNNILKNIQELNENIRKSDVRGDSALELRDQRNLLLDQLSQYVKIDVKYTLEDAGAGTMVEKLTVNIADSVSEPDFPNGVNLVDGIYATELSLNTTEGGNYDISWSPLLDKDGYLPVGVKWDQDVKDWKVLDDNLLQGSLQASREMLTEKGEFSTQTEIDNDPDATTKRGYPYYMKSLDLLANKFASIMNNANTYTDPDTQKLMGGILFSNGSNGDDTKGITASNITISHSWSIGNTKLLLSKDPNAASGATDNLAHIFAELTSTKHEFMPQGVNDELNPNAASKEALFNGTFQDMFLNIQSVLANDIASTTVVLQNHVTTSNEIYTDRDSVSGVDLNDEATNMMQYQKAYSAACRLMTVLDEALDKLINGTGRAGL